MNDFSKLMLSDEEQQLVNNPGWILTKRTIMDKVSHILASVSENQKTVIEKEKKWLPSAVVQSTPKISKGENYLQLPYMLLDHPRCFDGENIFAVRTMFWWGNFFSMTLLLSGSYKETMQEKLIKKLYSASGEFFICVNESQWHHHFGSDNYIPVKQFTGKDLQAVIHEKHFIKLAIQFPLHHWNDIAMLLDESFKEIIEMLKD